MRNELKYDYKELSLPNILQRTDKGSTSPSGVEEMLMSLLFKVARKYPCWEIICINPTKAIVYESREKLGEIRLSSEWSLSRGSHRQFAILCYRAAQELERKNERHTIHEKSALKIVNKYFGMRTPKEVMQDSAGSVLAMPYSQTHKVAEDIRNKHKLLHEHTEKFMEDNWEAVKKAAYASGCPAEVLDDLPELKAAAAIAKSMEERVDRGEAKILAPYKSAYVVAQPGTDVVRLTSDAEDPLTPEERTRFGMLKLVEAPAMVPNVGYRANNDIFLILTREEPEGDGQ